MPINPVSFSPGALPEPLRLAYANDYRKVLADQLSGLSTSDAPVYSTGQGALKVLAGLVGGYSQRKLNQDYKAKGESYTKDLADALGSDDPYTSLSRSQNPQVQDLATQMLIAQTKARYGATTPSNVQEYQYFQKLTPEQQKQFLTVKRANPSLNLGGSFVQRDQLTGDPVNEIQKTIPPQDTPATRGAQALAVEQAKINPAVVAGQAEASGLKERAEQQAQIAAAGPKKTATDVAAAMVEKRSNLPKAKASLSAISASSDRVIKEIDDAIKKVGFFTAGPGASLSVIPGTAARDLKAKIATIKANIGFDALQEMRANSPTGGALGQVAVQEIEYLQSVLGNLDQVQSPTQLGESLEQVRDQIASRRQRYQAAFDADFNDIQGLSAPENQQTPADPGLNDYQMRVLQQYEPGSPEFRAAAAAMGIGTDIGGQQTAPPKYSDEDLQYTAQQNGITVEEVKRRLGIQ